jgi:hypothetical protein
MAHFDPYGDRYREELSRAIGRLGDPGLYAEIKARTLIETPPAPSARRLSYQP